MRRSDLLSTWTDINRVRGTCFKGSHEQILFNDFNVHFFVTLFQRDANAGRKRLSIISSEADLARRALS
jgi:hypothetical protein